MRFLGLLLLRAVAGGFAVAVFLVAALAVVPPLTSAFMLQSAVADGRLPDYDWTSAANISPSMMLAVVAAEDQRFAEHSGFDFEAIEKAVDHNRHGGSTRGASTISQQVAKNLFLWSGRSWIRKGLEVVLTTVIETLWSKQRILEVYVNIAEMGDGVFGAEAASVRFFHKSASALTAEEAALLAAVLPNPREYRAGSPSNYVRKRQRWILSQMRALGGTTWLKQLSASKSASGSP